MFKLEGWIKLHRKILDNPIVCKDSDYLAVWIYLLLKASHDTYQAMFKGEKIELKPGQLITGRIKIANDLSVNESKVKRILFCFKKEHQIDQQSSNKNSLITVLNWELYQKSDQQNDQQMTSKRPANDQQMTTNKNVKNGINNISDEISESAPATTYRMIQDLYNSVCRSYPSLTKMSERRKKAINARLRSGYTIGDFRKLFEIAEKSEFLKGRNDRNWSATFDWMIQDGNMAKVLDGNYDDLKNTRKMDAGSKNKFNNFSQREYDYNSLEAQLLKGGDYSDGM